MGEKVKGAKNHSFEFRERKEKVGTAESESIVRESASTFTGGGHGRLENNDPHNKSVFVFKSSWRLNSVHSCAESHIYVRGGSKVNHVWDSVGCSKNSWIIDAFTLSRLLFNASPCTQMWNDLGIKVIDACNMPLIKGGTMFKPATLINTPHVLFANQHITKPTDLWLYRQFYAQV